MATKPKADNPKPTPAPIFVLPDYVRIIMVSKKGDRIRVKEMSYGEGKLIKDTNGWRNTMYDPKYCSYEPTE